MSFFDNIFGKRGESTSNVDWNPLSDITQLDTIIEDSDTKIQAIFKHSTRCGISSGVLRKFEQKLFDTSSSVELHFLDLIANRDVSNEIAERFNIIHQSPQLLLIRNREIIHYASHYDIVGDRILDFID